MSYLSRTLKKQYRILKSLEMTPLVTLAGLGLNKIVVFPERRDSQQNSDRLTKIYQNEIDAGEYRDIRAFDAIHTSDIEFSLFYRGKYQEKYNKATKLQMIRLGKKWRNRISKEHPDANIWIVVYFDDEDGWFLDTYNWDLTQIWDENPSHTVWL